MDYKESIEHQKICYNRAKKMRRLPTEAESELWERLKNRALGVRFIRQHVICHRIADFCAPSVGLVVEIDGGYHNAQKGKDSARDDYLRRSGGYTTMRFTNDQVMRETDLVLIKIMAFIVKRLKP